MEAYRDQYATLFNGGKKVTLLAISTDSGDELASWMRDARFPFTFGSDEGGKVGKLYDAYNSLIRTDNRSLYVVGPDGRIAYKALPFRQSSEEAYTELGQVIDRLSPP